MAKDPSPRADQLRAQREARYGHLQAVAGPKPPPPKKLIPYAGKDRGGIAPKPEPKYRREAKGKRADAVITDEIIKAPRLKPKGKKT
jgi:hypothetical protein